MIVKTNSFHRFCIAIVFSSASINEAGTNAS